MKPDWKDAPEWANYIVQDSNGSWWWHETNPVIGGDPPSTWFSRGRMRLAYSWMDSLERRP